jgi:hypothetical protein
MVGLSLRGDTGWPAQYWTPRFLHHIGGLGETTPQSDKLGRKALQIRTCHVTVAEGMTFWIWS